LEKVTVEKERNIFNAFRIKIIIHALCFKTFYESLGSICIEDFQLVIKFQIFNLL